MTEFKMVNKVPSIGGKVRGPSKGSAPFKSPAKQVSTSKASGPTKGQNVKIVSPAILKVSGKAKGEK